MYGELPLIETATGDKIPAIPIVIQNPQKTACMRLPTAEEISAYTASIRQLVRSVGRRQSEDIDVPNHEAERKLFQAARIDKGEDFDDAEVRYAVNLVLRHEVEDCEKDGEYYVVTIRTLWGVVAHTCRTPTTRELQHYRENVIKSRALPRNVEERRFPPGVPAEFYDAIIVSAEGYAPQFNVPVGTVNGNGHVIPSGPLGAIDNNTRPVIEGAELKSFLPQIPPHHKRSVAGEISSAIYDLDPQFDPNA